MNIAYSENSIFSLSNDDIKEESPLKSQMQHQDKLSARDHKGEKLEEGEHEISYLSLQGSINFEDEEDKNNKNFELKKMIEIDENGGYLVSLKERTKLVHSSLQVNIKQMSEMMEQMLQRQIQRKDQLA